MGRLRRLRREQDDACLRRRSTSTKTYKVGTNEFLAPAGGDGYNGFKYMKNITYWGDMLNAVNAYVAANYGTPATAYKGPNGDGTLDGRITRDGTDAGGSIVPVTILHHNDSHGNLAKGSFVGYTQLATLIKQERLHNPTRTLLLNGGDNIQGDAMSYYFKSAPLGYAADGTPLAAALQMQPLIKAFNSLSYDAMTLGNHEFNFGSAIFKAVLGQATFPILGANVTDTGAYGLARRSASSRTSRRPSGPKGSRSRSSASRTTASRTTSSPATSRASPSATRWSRPRSCPRPLRGSNDAVVALTHIGFTENPKSVEVDKNVDTNMAADRDRARRDRRVAQPHEPGDRVRATTSTCRRSSPARTTTPVVISQAYRYNNTLGEIVLGMRAKAGGGYEVVSRTGRYLSVHDVDRRGRGHQGDRRPVRGGPRRLQRHGHRQDDGPDRHAGRPSPQETNGANLQADAAVFELSQARDHAGRPPVGRDDEQEDRRRGHAPPARSPSRSRTCSRPCRTRTRSSSSG